VSARRLEKIGIRPTQSVNIEISSCSNQCHIPYGPPRFATNKLIKARYLRVTGKAGADLALSGGMKIEVRLDEQPDSSARPDGGLEPVEVLEGSEEFLQALSIRLNEIVLKPNGRFVISYITGKPGSKTPPRVQ
jgi:hypothetical protein